MDNEIYCNTGVIHSATLAECSNHMQTPGGIYGPLVGKIPVVLAEPVVQIVVESSIKLEEPALEIKRIKKNLFVNQCKVIDLGGTNTGKLFLSGFVRKNIEYATVAEVCEKHKGISGDIRHLTVDVPFTCVTEIYYAVPPQLHYQEGARELSFNTHKLQSKDCCSEMMIGSSPCEQTFQHTEFFNEKIFCELVEAKFFENDIQEGGCPLECDFPGVRTFDRITEKLVILVQLKILQDQQVNMPGKYNSGDGKPKYK